MRVKSNKRMKLIATLLVLVMLISVGYAFLSTQLTINGSATVKNQSWNIYFTNVVPTQGSITPSTAPTTEGTTTTELTWVVSMDTPGQFYEFTVDAVNSGTMDAMISTGTANLMSTLTADQEKYLDYTVTYSDGAVIEQYDTLAAGATETLKVRVEFKRDITANDLPATADQITLTYASEYVQADTNAKARNVVQQGQTVQSLALGGQINRWDPVAYNPGTLTTASIDLPDGASLDGSRLASVNLPSGATLGGTINASSATNWVVLDVTDDGDVLIIPRNYSNVQLTLSGMNGYNNAIEALDEVASIYLNPAQASSARSITVEDVNNVAGYTPEGSGYSYSWNSRYGMDGNLNIVDYGTRTETGTSGIEETVDNIAGRDYRSTPETAYYDYFLSNNITQYFTAGYCWLASRCVNLDSSYCGFNVRNLYGGGSVGSNGDLFDVSDNGNSHGRSYSCSVLPVVTLKSSVLMDKVEGTWEFTE